MAKSWAAPKDPDEIKDYTVDWSPLLGSDTLSGSTWDIVNGSGLTIAADSRSDTETVVWVSGGTDGATYDLRNRVTTTGGRTYDQTCRLKCKTK